MIYKTGISGLINVGDSLFPFFPQEAFRRLLYLWDSHNVLGRDTSATVSQLPWYGLAALLERLGTPLWLINRLWFVLPFLLLGLSMHFLSGVIFGQYPRLQSGVKNEKRIPKEKKTSRFVATLFFMFNPFTINLVGGSTILTLSFTAGVFVFGFFVRGLEKPKVAVKDVVFLGLGSIFMPANLVVWVMMLLLCVAYFLFFVLVNRKNTSRLHHALKFSLITGAYCLVTNLWWLLPLACQFTSSEYFGTLFASGTDVGTFEFISQFTSLFDVSRLFYGMTPTANFPISHYYHYLLAPTMMAVLVVLVFSVTLFKKKSRFEIFFLLLAVFSVILASGIRPPLGFVYQFLWDHVPYFHIFRTTNRFNLYTMISYAILLGFLCQRIKNRFFITSFLLISILLSSWPLLSGDLYGQLQPHQIPQDYYDLREFLQNQEGDFRVMNFPLTTWSVPYSWSAPFDMQEILIDFSPKDVIVNGSGYLQDLKEREVSENDPVYALVYKHLERNEAIALLKVMGVRYLVVHHDYVIVHGKYFPVDVSEVTNTLQKADGIRLVRAFGDLDIYEVEDFQPRIFSTSGEVDYVKISPTEYRVRVQDVREPFTLVLAENFHPGWESSVGEQVKFGEFANGWEIDETGDYDVVLRYKPQKLFELGLLVSVLSLAGGLSVLLYLGLRKK